MRVCPKCGSRIDDNAEKCPVCESGSEEERRSYKRSSKTLYYVSIILTSLYAVICAVNGIANILGIRSNIRSLDDSYFGMVGNDHVLTVIYTVSAGLLPLIFILFIGVIMVSERSALLLVFPVAGILVEIAQIIKEYRNYLYIIREKQSYFYGIMAMDIFSALLVILFFAFMIRMILKDFTISQSRMLVVFAFILVASRVLLKINMSDEPEILRFVSNTKAYILFSAILMNVRKRYSNSRKM
ncbi:MAG: zinc ribbon domain-containing protein [Ruminococcus sp.]|uniref:zinc ribbon domain-containing protein n=1 Tax=Ruminococcus sp. TaxID=41978 RepID=UPI0025E47091|nr:zinc ribbon domain-containing protein [Ruminococcus sp.]MBR5684054.1 zinc ribbon domain-containing protein [Ruminococcus sp.]